MFAKKGLESKCLECGNKIKIFKIDERGDNLKELLICSNCGIEINSLAKVINNFTFNFKKILYSYFYGERKCVKCRSTTRLFLRKK
jgi:hypothetical protein